MIKFKSVSVSVCVLRKKEASVLALALTLALFFAPLTAESCNLKRVDLFPLFLQKPEILPVKIDHLKPELIL
jgi:hypothetical protein